MKTSLWLSLLLVLAQAAAGGTSLPERQVLFESNVVGNDDVWVMDTDGGNRRRLTTDRAADKGPVWAPDGSRIAFFSTRDGDAEIYSMKADGSDLRQLTHNSAFDAYPAWSSQGEIAFLSGRDEAKFGTLELYKMAEDGTEQTRLTDNAAQDAYPSWTPDGKHILFASTPLIEGTADLLTEGFEIFRMGSDGQGVERLTNNLCDDHAPASSPDGAWIAFASDCGRPFTGITVMRSDGTGVRALTANVDQEDWPTWSPEGTDIVFASTRDGGNPTVLFGAMDIVVMKPDGSAARNVTTSPLVFEGLPWFSPSATR